MASHIPNASTYRPYLGEAVNRALFEIVTSRNEKGFTKLSVTDYLEKMILHWYRSEFPERKVPFSTKAYIEDFDFVQSG